MMFIAIISNINNNKDEKACILQSGIYAFAMEHGAFEQVKYKMHNFTARGLITKGDL